MENLIYQVTNCIGSCRPDKDELQLGEMVYLELDRETIPSFPVKIKAIVTGVVVKDVPYGNKFVKGREYTFQYDETLLPSAVKRLEKCNVLTVPYCVTCCDLLNERVDVVQAEVDASEIEITALKGRVTTAEGEIDALQAADTALAGRVTVAEGEIDALQAGQIVQDGKILAAESEIDALQASQIVQDGKILAAELEIDALQAAGSALAGRVTTAEGEIDALQAADTLLAGRVSLVEGKVIQSFVFNSSTNKLRLTLQDTSFLEVDLAALAGGGGSLTDTNTTYGIELDADGHTLKLLGSDSTVDTLDLKPIIEAYSVPFTGGTLTGALVGTNITLSGQINAINAPKAFLHFSSPNNVRRGFNISFVEKLSNGVHRINFTTNLPADYTGVATTSTDRDWDGNVRGGAGNELRSMEVNRCILATYAITDATIMQDPATGCVIFI